MSHLRDSSVPLYNLHASTSAVLTCARSELFASRLFRDQSSLRTVVVPQAAEYLTGDHFAHVHTDQSNNEHAVTAQVVLGELGKDARLSLSGVERSQLLADVLYLTRPVQCPKQPLEEVDDADQRQSHEPEPDEQENLLVEKVDGQRALNDVVVKARLSPDLEFTQRDSWKAFRLGPVLTTQKTLNDVRAVQMVVVDKQSVQQEQLTNGVYHVYSFDHQVSADEVVAIETAADDTTNLSDEVLNADTASSAIVALRQQIAIHLVDDVADCLLADLQVGRLGADVSRIHQRAEVDARPPVEKTPDLARNERQNALEDEYEWYPLVIADALLP